jgi:hypothetical protein
MPRYFFDLRDGDNLAVDEEGIELPSLIRVQEEAASSLAEMARERVIEGFQANAEYMAIEVRDEHGPLMKALFTFEAELTRH